MSDRRPRRGRPATMAAIVAALVAAACSSTPGNSTDGSQAAATSGTSGDRAPAATTTDPARRPSYRYPDAPPTQAADAPTAAAADEAIASIVGGLDDGGFDYLNVDELGQVGDVRHAWFLADLLRFFGGEEAQQILASFQMLTGISIAGDPESNRSPWTSVTNRLIAWDTPDYPNYRVDKSGVFLLIEPAWEPFFSDVDASIDWRYVSWGGVFIDDREFDTGAGCPGGCIPALDDPAVTDAAGGAWYPDERVVFGIVEGGEALAIPLNIAEVHEMFNLTLGGRRIGMPYCTLCGSAQAYYLDDTGAVEQPVLRTSGLLSRSNKVMYDIRTMSAFDTFTGAAVSGPLQDEGVVLRELTVVRSTWGEWKAVHPETAIVAQDGGIGRSYEFDPLGDRDANGPIFPVGDVDGRLGVQEFVVGVVTADGRAIAFPADLASSVLAAGDDVALAGVALVAAGDGLRAVDATTGDELAAHEAFWFAWSQFHPDTLLWMP